VPRLHALKLDAVVELLDLDAVEHAVEIEVPPRAAEFAVGRDLEPDFFLLLDDLLDLAVLDLLELRRGDLALLPLGPRFLQRRGAQNCCRPRRRETAVWFSASGNPPRNLLCGTQAGQRAFRQLKKERRTDGRSPNRSVIIRAGLIPAICGPLLAKLCRYWMPRPFALRHCKPTVARWPIEGGSRGMTIEVTPR
jgi:hypothetical protein